MRTKGNMNFVFVVTTKKEFRPIETQTEAHRPEEMMFPSPEYFNNAAAILFVLSVVFNLALMVFVG